MRNAVWLTGSRDEVASFSPARRLTVPPFFTRLGPPGPVAARPVGRRITLTGHSFGGLRFGTPQATAVAPVRKVLGLPAAPASTAECGVTAVTWPVVIDPATGRLVRAQDVTLAFARGRFVGYQLSGSGRESASPTGPDRGYAAVTARGLRLDDTLARARRLYGRVFTTSSAQGGSWSVRTPQGRLDGYASGVPTDGDLGRLTITSIDAGDVGCPAVSP